MEKRHNYVRKVAETAVQLFVSNDKVNVAGMVLAGSADFKTELSQSDMFDPVSLTIPVKHYVKSVTEFSCINEITIVSSSFQLLRPVGHNILTRFLLIFWSALRPCLINQYAFIQVWNITINAYYMGPLLTLYCFVVFAAEVTG